MALRYVQASKVRVFMKEKGLRTGQSFLEALDREVHVLLDKYQQTAKMDRRKTVLASDIELASTISRINRSLR